MSDRRDIIKLYGACSVELAHLLKAEGPLDMEEQLTVQNGILIVQLAMMTAKYGVPGDLPSAA